MYVAVIADDRVVSVENNDGLATMQVVANWRFGRPTRILRILVSAREFRWYSEGYDLEWDYEEHCIRKCEAILY